MENPVRFAVLTAGILLVGCLAFSSGAVAQQAGRVSGIEGEATILKSESVEPKPLNGGGPVAVGDEVSTAPDSKLWLTLRDNSHHSLGKTSAVLFNDMGSEAGASFFHSHMAQGIVRFIKKLDKTSPPSSYVITTPTALISVQPTDRPADFVVEVLNEYQTMVTVIWGRISVKNILEKLTEERVLTSCQRVLVYAGKEPSRIYRVDSATLQDVIGRTTIPGTLPEDTPACESPRERPCSCPWGEAMDRDGRCKPCAFAAGAFYDPDSCECLCPCPEGTYPHPIDGSCGDRCPTLAPIEMPGSFGPDPDVLPHEGCPRCACCPHDRGCVTSVPWDASCSHPRCGRCPEPPGPVVPPILIPPDPFAWSECAKCCDCDLWWANPGDPCGLNAAGFPNPSPCSPGSRCIPRSQCLAMGGHFIRTESRIPFRPCWVCQREEPVLAMKMGQGGGCDECQRLTFRKGKPECVPVKDKSPCYSEGKCGTCRKGKCVELPPCPPRTQRNAKCVCEKTQEKPPVKPPAEQCTSNEDCRAKTRGKSPCCRGGECVSFVRCSDGKYHCRCEDQPEPTPRPPGVVPTPQCSPCNIWVDGRCLPCNAMNMRCIHGRCVPKGPGDDPRTRCRQCEERVKGRCLPCDKIGKRCVNGLCVDREIKPTTCGRCEVKLGNSCVPCKAANMRCANGRCVRRDTPTDGLGPDTGPSTPKPKRCGSCEVKVRGRCLSCEQIGKPCRNGHCVERTEPSRPVEVKPKPSHPRDAQPKPSKPVDVERPPSHPRDVQPKPSQPKRQQVEPDQREVPHRQEGTREIDPRRYR